MQLTFSLGQVGIEYSEEASLLSDSPFSPPVEHLFFLFLPLRFGAKSIKSQCMKDKND